MPLLNPAIHPLSQANWVEVHTPRCSPFPVCVYIHELSLGHQPAPRTQSIVLCISNYLSQNMNNSGYLWQPSTAISSTPMHPHHSPFPKCVVHIHELILDHQLAPRNQTTSSCACQITLAKTWMTSGTCCSLQKPHIFKATISWVAVSRNVRFQEVKLAPVWCSILVEIVGDSSKPRPINFHYKYLSIRLERKGQGYGFSWHSCVVCCENNACSIWTELWVIDEASFCTAQDHVKVRPIWPNQVQCKCPLCNSKIHQASYSKFKR